MRTAVSRRLTQALGASALAGFATGGRTFTGLAALALTAPTDALNPPDTVLRHPATQGLIGLAAAGEWVGDVLPNTPTRLTPGGFGGRLVAGAGCGVLIARRGDGPAVAAGPTANGVADPASRSWAAAHAPLIRDVACVAVALAGTVATTYLGVQFRSWATSALGNRIVPALLEDALVLAAAAGAARYAGPGS